MLIATITQLQIIDALLLKNIPTINRYAMYHDNIFAHVLNFGPKLHYYRQIIAY